MKLRVLIALGSTLALIAVEIREAFSSVAGAADRYQSFLLGRPTMDESVEEAAQHTITDKFTTGE